MKNRIILIIIGVISITLLEIIALVKNINGQLFSVAIGSITALVGYAFGISKQGK